MGFFDQVRAKRQRLADVLAENPGIRKHFEDMYPARAHFIFELLQNAEDTGARKATFTLDTNALSFEHNGRPFTEDDVWGITTYGESPKVDKKRFGIGFKAVFAYTETPHIWSPTFSFKMSRLVVPTEITPRPELGPWTRFEFQFDNPKKKPQEAYAEIEGGLEKLAGTTPLLFVTHLESICWKIGRNRPGEVSRVEHSEHHLEVSRQSDGKTTAREHFLRFSDFAQDSKDESVSVAFALDYLPKVTAFDDRKPLAKQLRIVPANPGRVAALFPAEKETSGLRFHLDAPFVVVQNRASVKDTPANEPLFKRLAELAATSLHAIRSMNLLTGDFLGVLPNQKDVLATHYEPICMSIIEAMNNEPLTPTHSRSHAPARHLLQARASLKELLSTKDLELLVRRDGEPLHWAIGASQKDINVNHFLSGLAITEWDKAEFMALLEAKASDNSWMKPDADFITWLSTKPPAWHQQLYSLLYQEYATAHNFYRLKPLRIVRLSDSTYSVGTNCYFPSDGVEQDETFPRVARGIYLSGKNKKQQEEARKLLEDLGVHEVGETEQVQAILKQRYTYEAEDPNRKTYLKDLRRFIALVDKEPQHAQMLGEYYIFQQVGGDWVTPNGVFLDSPYLETGLRAYYSAIGASAPRAALARSYERSGISVNKLKQFAEAVGVQTKLKPELVSCHLNPEWPHLASAPGQRRRNGTNQDYMIPQLDKLLSKPTIALSKLIWRTMCDLERKYLIAEYGMNQAKGCHVAASQLVLQLRTCAWVPQTNRTCVRPAEASKGLLPDGFPFNDGNGWLSAIQFGEQRQQRVEETKKRASAARELGFPDADSLERARQFTSLPLAEQERVLAEFQAKQHRELPEHEPRNPKRRAEHVAQQAADAPEPITEKRQRSVSVGKGEVKEKADQYLRAQYTHDDEMICQVCKAPLPFKLADGSYYFESVPFLSGLKKRHYENYLALCPNHSAMFQLANGSQDSLGEIFGRMLGNELEVVLGQEDTTIYFTKTHIADLQEVLKVESAEGGGPGDDSK